MRTLFIVIGAVLLFMMSPRLYSESTESKDNTYVFYVEQVECDVSHMKKRNMGSAKFPAMTMIHHNEMAAFQDAKVTKYQAIELTPGQERKIDQQHQIKSATEFDPQGNPTNGNPRNIGKKIRIGLIAATNGVVPNKSFKDRDKTTTLLSLSVDFEDANLLSTDTYSNVQTTELEMSNPQIKPSGNKASVLHTPGTKGSITVWPGGWFQLGGISDRNQCIAWFLKVDKKAKGANQASEAIAPQGGAQPQR